MADMLNKIPLQYEPLRANRFVLRFPSDLGIQSWWVESASGPRFSQDVVQIPLFNSSTKVSGRYLWNPIDLTFRQSIGASTAQAFMEWLRLMHESATGRSGYAAGYKRTVELSALDPTGVSVQKWILVNAFIGQSANFGDFNYASSELLKLTWQLEMDYAILAY